MPKKYWTRLIIGSVVFGVFTFGPVAYNAGTWNWRDLWLVLYGAVAFGVLFHVLFSFIIKQHDKNDDNQ